MSGLISPSPPYVLTNTFVHTAQVSITNFLKHFLFYFYYYYIPNPIPALGLFYARDSFYFKTSLLLIRTSVCPLFLHFNPLPSPYLFREGGVEVTIFIIIFYFSLFILVNFFVCVSRSFPPSPFF